MYDIVSDKISTWFKDSIICIANEDYIEVVTPFLDSSNDFITIYVTRGYSDNDFLLGDDGEIFDIKEVYGYDIKSKEARERFEKIANMTGCYIEDYEIRTRATKENLGFKVNQLAMAMMRISNIELA